MQPALRLTQLGPVLDAMQAKTKTKIGAYGLQNYKEAIFIPLTFTFWSGGLSRLALRPIRRGPMRTTDVTKGFENLFEILANRNLLASHYVTRAPSSKYGIPIILAQFLIPINIENTWTLVQKKQLYSASSSASAEYLSVPTGYHDEESTSALVVLDDNDDIW